MSSHASLAESGSHQQNCPSNQSSGYKANVQFFKSLGFGIIYYMARANGYMASAAIIMKKNIERVNKTPVAQ